MEEKKAEIEKSVLAETDEIQRQIEEIKAKMDPSYLKTIPWSQRIGFLKELWTKLKELLAKLAQRKKDADSVDVASPALSSLNDELASMTSVVEQEQNACQQELETQKKVLSEKSEKLAEKFEQLKTQVTTEGAAPDQEVLVELKRLQSEMNEISTQSQEVGVDVPVLAYQKDDFEKLVENAQQKVEKASQEKDSFSNDITSLESELNELKKQLDPKYLSQIPWSERLGFLRELYRKIKELTEKLFKRKQEAAKSGLVVENVAQPLESSLSQLLADAEAQTKNVQQEDAQKRSTFEEQLRQLQQTFDDISNRLGGICSDQNLGNKISRLENLGDELLTLKESGKRLRKDSVDFGLKPQFDEFLKRIVDFTPQIEKSLNDARNDQIVRTQDLRKKLHEQKMHAKNLRQSLDPDIFAKVPLDEKLIILSSISKNIPEINKTLDDILAASEEIGNPMSDDVDQVRIMEKEVEEILEQLTPQLDSDKKRLYNDIHQIVANLNYSIDEWSKKIESVKPCENDDVGQLRGKVEQSQTFVREKEADFKQNIEELLLLSTNFPSDVDLKNQVKMFQDKLPELSSTLKTNEQLLSKLSVGLVDFNTRFDKTEKSLNDAENTLAVAQSTPDRKSNLSQLGETRKSLKIAKEKELPKLFATEKDLSPFKLKLQNVSSMNEKADKLIDQCNVSLINITSLFS